ncbi:hypothetical protein [Propionivibrio limicola]|uniref:hypothetical protein n=1 Tax=Propionivibrio limicola TaxID=167645 RepID=UPI001292AD92|nr:hypothetical protein [Propionivibrio limicola]
MPIPTSLVASIISAVIETAVQGGSVDTTKYQSYVTNRSLPPEAKQGVMLPPKGDGYVSINGKSLVLSPAAQFRNQQNLIVLPMTIKNSSDVVYLVDSFGNVNRVWLLTPA